MTPDPDRDLAWLHKQRRFVIVCSWGALAANVWIVVDALRDRDWARAVANVFVVLVVAVSLRVLYVLGRRWR